MTETVTGGSFNNFKDEQNSFKKVNKMATDNVPRFPKPMKKERKARLDKEFTILESEKPTILEKQITKHLNEGWKLHGQMAIVMNEYNKILYVQPMVISTFKKPEEEKPADWWQKELEESLKDAQEEVKKLQKEREVTKEQLHQEYSKKD